jgi:hypothetical protein
MRRTLLALSLPLAAAALCAGLLMPAPRASALVPLASTPPAGVSVEAKDASFDRGFDFRFKSDSGSTATISIDPLGTKHSDTASLSSRSGSISLSGKYDRSDRRIEVVAKRGGSEIGTFTWSVEAVLR